MRNILITGANRGIGLEFVRQLAVGTEKESGTIIATCRNPEKAQELNAIKSSSKVNLHILKIDITNPDDIATLLPSVQSILGANKGLNLLINNAGYGPLLTLEETTQDELQKMFSINTFAPLMVTKALLPLLRMSADSSPGTGMSCSKSAVVNISSGLGTFAIDIPSGPEGARIRKFMGYSSSKSGLNMLMRYLATEIAHLGVLVVLLHPGWVKTDMGGSAAPLTTEESVSDMLTTLTSLNESHHGKLFSHNGEPLNW